MPKLGNVKETVKTFGIVASVAIVLVLGLQFGLPLLHIPTYILPLPSAVLNTLITKFPLLVPHIWQTFYETIVGFLLALVIGIILAIGVVYSRTLNTLLTPFFAALHAFPKIALAPLLVIWLGVGVQPKILVSFLIAVFPIFISGVTGLGQIELDWLDLATLSGANHWRVFAKIRLPNALPYLLDACKVAVPLAMIGAITGEFIAGSVGLGYVILRGQFQIETDLVFAALILILIITTSLLAIVVMLEKMLLKWRPSERMKARGR